MMSRITRLFLCRLNEEKNEHYVLWEVIEFGDSYKAPQEEAASKSSVKKKGRTIVITTEDMQKRRNGVKARTTLLLALPDEHQLRFNKYETAQELWGAILKTFGGNEATKKTKKNQLKQQYGNFKAEGSETLEQTFNRLQAIVSHLEFMGVDIEQDDLNQKFLTSLARQWLMYTIVWRNKGDLDTMSLDDPKLAVKKGKLTLLVFQLPALKFSLLVLMLQLPIDEDDIEEMDIKWNIALLSMRADRFWKKTRKKITIQGTDVVGFDKSNVECFNCHKMGHFARECRAPRSQDRGRKENYKQGSKEEEPAPKALMAIDGVVLDWSYMANKAKNHALVADDEAPIEFALMAKSSSSSKNEVEARLVEFKTQEIIFCEKIRGLEFDVESKNNKIKRLMNELEQVKKEKDGLDSKFTSFEYASKDLDTLLGSQIFDKNKEDDTITDYSRPSPSIESNSNDLQNSNSFVSEHGESSSSILSKPMIKFVKAADSPTDIKTNKVETVRKSSIRYAKMYRNTSKSAKVRGNQINWNNLKTHQLGKDFVMKNKACFNVDILIIWHMTVVYG
nr:hypothetical protein [Tanacetum cinerariifolium]